MNEICSMLIKILNFPLGMGFNEPFPSYSRGAFSFPFLA